jgi:hypothetical protein
MNKKGLSDVVSNVLIILIVVAAVAVLGYVVMNLINTSDPTAKAVCQTLDFKVDECIVDGGVTKVNVVYSSGNSDFVVENLNVNFMKDDLSSMTNESGTIRIGETRTLSVNGVAEKVYPVVIGKYKDKDVSCVLDQYEKACS